MDPMNAQQNSLAQLKDIHLPAPSPWWDLAVGWWILLVLLFGVMVWGVPQLQTYWKKRKQRHILKRAMQTKLKILCDQYAKDKDAMVLLANINVLLKQVVLTVFPEQHAANLAGQDWLDFLDSLWVNKPAQSFTRKPIVEILNDGAYRPSLDVDAQDIQSLCDTVKAWLKAVERHV